MPPCLLGLETELGIARDDAPDLDVVAESIALVRGTRLPSGPAPVLMRWDYSRENPHRDVRGFEVDSLRQDTDEAHYLDQDARRELSFTEIKSDLVLPNGARFYNDHAHPEYCTPECLDPGDLAVHDRAGEHIAMEAARHLSGLRGSTVRLYKNNTDFAGHSYGCHENYLLPRALDWNTLAHAILAFLVTRQTFAGAGKFALETEDRLLGPGFQISQRSDFFSELQGVDTMQRRPILNTRDEPHADPTLWRRFHVILGDANMAPFATRLKTGTTALVLEAIASRPDLPWPRLANPLQALHAISRDPSWRWETTDDHGRPTTALEIQRTCVDLVARACDLGPPGRSALVADWRGVIDDLALDPLRCADRVDWVAKHQLIRSFQAASRLADDDPWLASLDLEYHRLDPDCGLYFALEQAGSIRGVPPAADVARAIDHGPANTRAGLRGACVRRFPNAIRAAQWDHVTLETRLGPWRLDLPPAPAPDEMARLLGLIESANSPDDLRFALTRQH